MTKAVAMGRFWVALSFIGAASWAWLYKFVEAWFFDKVLHLAKPYEEHFMSVVIQYGPSLLLVLLAAYILFHRAEPVAAPIAIPASSALVSPQSSDALNLEEWLGHPNYFVWVAACLWIGRKPDPTIDQNHPAYPTLQMIKGHLQANTIKSLYGDTGMKAKVAREELIKLATIRQERPDFLFRTSRGQQINDNEWNAQPRVPLISLFARAEKLFVGPGPAIIPFCADLRQAGLDGDLVFRGRPIRWSTNDKLALLEPLNEIPSDHWKDFEIAWGYAVKLDPKNGNILGVDNENPLLRTQTPIVARQQDVRYLDLHVDQPRASAWLSLEMMKLNKS
jgi:hypothetical protein